MSDEVSKKFREAAMNASPLQAIEESGPMDDNCPAARIGELGNQVHNLGCDYQNDEDLSDELGQVAVTLWDLAKKAAIRTQAQRERDEIVDEALGFLGYKTASQHQDATDAGWMKSALRRMYDAGMLWRAGE